MIVLQTDYIDESEQQRFAARVICDECQQRIGDHKVGFVVARWNEEENCPYLDEVVLHTHGGKCLSDAKAKLQSGDDGMVYWESLSRHLVELVVGCGMTQAELNEIWYQLE